MKITQSFTVAAAPGRVWSLFQDVPTIARCMPGATLGDRTASGTHTGTLTVRLGPMTASFQGEAQVTADAVSRTGTMIGSGVDRGAGSRGRVELGYRLTGEGEATRVEIDADVTLTGAAAQFGRPALIDEMAKRIVADFSACLEAVLGAPDPSAASQIVADEVRGVRLLLAGLWGAFTRFLSRLTRRGA
ncbi:MAG TPA: SRPBCC family protein [Acidimicrobiia bacterium]|nr:SRPBCC family protein [Acidimicrobiia bacterium]